MQSSRSTTSNIFTYTKRLLNKNALPGVPAERIKVVHLELHLGGKLKLTRRSSISDRATCLRDLAEAGAARRCRQHWVAEVSLVEYVKRICAKNKVHILRNPGRLLQRDIRIGEACAVKDLHDAEDQAAIRALHAGEQHFGDARMLAQSSVDGFDDRPKPFVPRTVLAPPW